MLPFRGITKRAAVPKPEPAPSFLKYAGLARRHRVWVHGHRGSASSHPENTAISFEEGAKAGSELVELDVHLSADGIPVVFHDEMISNRVCRDLQGRKLRRKLAVRKLTVEQLGLYDIGSVKPRKFPGWHHCPGERIQTLDTICAWAARQNPAVGLNIEIKMGGEPLKLRPDPDEFAEAVTASVKKHNLLGRVQLQSFYPQAVASLSRTAPQEKISLLVDRGVKWIPLAKKLGASVVGPRFRLLDRKLIASCHAEGLAVVPWTVNKELHWKRLVEWGVDGLITDYPRKLVQFLSRYN